MSERIYLASPIIGDDELAAVERVLRSGTLAQGPETGAFETEFAETVDGLHCVAVNSGTSALIIALRSLDIGPGDDVIVPSFTFAATANAVVLVGASPVFVDIEPTTFGMDPDAISAAVTSRTVAVMPVHLYGHPAAAEVVEVARKTGLALVEDASQAHLASLDGRPIGTLGDIACFSFYATKNMTTGEGGMVVTASDEVARTARMLRNQGMEQRYGNEIVGYNMRMTDLQAAIGRAQLRSLAEWTQDRRDNATALSNSLSGVVTPTERPGAHHVYHQYTIRVDHERRDALSDHLASVGIGSAVYYPTPTHLLPAYGLSDLSLSQTNRAAAEVLSLPVHPGLSSDNLDRIANEVNRFMTG